MPPLDTDGDVVMSGAGVAASVGAGSGTSTVTRMDACDRRVESGHSWLRDTPIAFPPPPPPSMSRVKPGTVVHPTVVMDCDCCGVQHDDGLGWYKGRAGTSAYWSPQMISRDSRGERLAYGADADWWSFGCLLYCLMTGRSPFASGMGSSYDNQLTVEGRISWPRGIFSRDAKDLITRLLTVDPAKRLGSGPQGWKQVMAHPWFARTDWALLEAKVLPAPCIPPYRMATHLAIPPEKIEGQYRNAAAEAAADAEMRVAAARLELTAEDEAIFRATTYTAPDWLVRGILKAIQANEGHAYPQRDAIDRARAEEAAADAAADEEDALDDFDDGGDLSPTMPMGDALTGSRHGRDATTGNSAQWAVPAATQSASVSAAAHSGVGMPSTRTLAVPLPRLTASASGSSTARGQSSPIVTASSVVVVAATPVSGACIETCSTVPGSGAHRAAVRRTTPGF